MRNDSDATTDAARERRQPQGTAQAFLTLIEGRSDDTVEIKGKQFRFRPYTGHGTAESRDTDQTRQAKESESIESEIADEELAVDILDGLGANPRNSSAFIASFIAQQRLRQGLHNPQFEAASDAYRRAGASPSAVDNQPRILSFAV